MHGGRIRKEVRGWVFIGGGLGLVFIVVRGLGGAKDAVELVDDGADAQHAHCGK